VAQLQNCKNTTFEAPVAKAYPGKKHPYLQFLDEKSGKNSVNLGFQK